MSEPVTREEQLLSAIATGGDILSPITRQEMYLAYLAGDTSISLPEPVTRKEQFLYQACLTGGSGGEGITPAGTKSITENGIYDVTRYASADVNVPTEEINNQDKTITANGEYTADTGYTGLGTVTVAVPEKEPVLQDKEVTENGTYTAGEGYDGLGEVVVNVPSSEPVIEPLTVTENGTHTPPEGVDGYNPVTVNVAASGGGAGDGGLNVLNGEFVLAVDNLSYGLELEKPDGYENGTAPKFCAVINTTSLLSDQNTQSTMRALFIYSDGETAYKRSSSADATYNVVAAEPSSVCRWYGVKLWIYGSGDANFKQFRAGDVYKYYIVL